MTVRRTLSLLLVALFVLTSCSPGPTTTGGSAPTTSTGPKKGGVLKITYGPDPPHYDTHQQGSYVTLYLTANCYNQLLRPDPDDETKLIGDLAKSWEFSADGKAITFKLETGVSFHDGTAFGAKDVAYTFNRLLKPPTGMIMTRRGIFANIESIQTPDEQTVTFTLKRPQPDIVWAFADGTSHIFPKHVGEPLDAKGEGFRKTIMGTGAFKLVRGIEGEIYELTRNDKYFRENKPYLDGIQFYPIRETTLQSAALETGKIDFISYSEDAGALDRLKANKSLTVIEKQRLFIVNVIPRLVAPWDNPKAREALSLAIDRQQFIATMGDIGFVKFHAFGLMPPGSPFALKPDDIRPIGGYDTTPGVGGDIRTNRARARQLLREAGVAEGTKVNLATRADLASFRDSAVAVASQLREIGLDAVAQPMELGRYTQATTSGDFEIAVHSLAAGNPTIDGIIGEIYTSYGGRNYGKWNDPSIDAAYEALSIERDQTKRIEMARAFQLNFLKTFYHINIGWRGSGVAYRNEVKGFKPHTSNSINMNLDGVWLDR